MNVGHNQHKQFDELQATALFCPKCRQATPVRQRLLLFLPNGELHEYLCQYCGSSVGTKKVTQQPDFHLAAR